MRDNIKMDLRNGMGRHGLNISGGKLGQVVGSFEYGNGPLGSVECSKNLILQRNCKHLKKGCTLWSFPLVRW